MPQLLILSLISGGETFILVVLGGFRIFLLFVNWKKLEWRLISECCFDCVQFKQRLGPPFPTPSEGLTV